MEYSGTLAERSGDPQLCVLVFSQNSTLISAKYSATRLQFSEQLMTPVRLSEDLVYIATTTTTTTTTTTATMTITADL